jgi:cytochrome c-type biogenesis protein
MGFSWGTYALGFVAGALSTLSPCVLPLVPILFASALSAHRLGPAALAAGLALSFAAIGIALATIGASLGLDNELLRRVAAALLIVFGMAMVSGRVAARFAAGASPFAERARAWLQKLRGDTLRGQFGVGILLGAVWAP